MAPSKTAAFDLWYSQLQQAGERYGPAWALLAEALEEHRTGLQAVANSSFTVRQSRLPESAQEYLSVLRAITDLIAKGPGAFAGIRYHSAGAGERRLACRYPIRTELEYRLMARGEIIETGRGRSINTSSSGILFESERALPPQMIIQVSLDWPGRPSAAVTVDLHVAGRTVRGQGNYTAVAIERHEFRIAREARIRDRR